MQVHRFCCILNLLANPPSLLSGVYGFIVPHALSTIYPEIGAWTILTLTASTCVTWVAAVMTWVTDTECLCFLTEHTAQAVINEEIWVSSLSPCMKTGETSVYSCGNMSVFWSIMCWFRVFSDTFQSHKCGGNWEKPTAATFRNNSNTTLIRIPSYWKWIYLQDNLPRLKKTIILGQPLPHSNRNLEVNSEDVRRWICTVRGMNKKEYDGTLAQKNPKQNKQSAFRTTH